MRVRKQDFATTVSLRFIGFSAAVLLLSVVLLGAAPGVTLCGPLQVEMIPSGIPPPSPSYLGLYIVLPANGAMFSGLAVSHGPIPPAVPYSAYEFTFQVAPWGSSDPFALSSTVYVEGASIKPAKVVKKSTRGKLFMVVDQNPKNLLKTRAFLNLIMCWVSTSDSPSMKVTTGNLR